MASFLDVCRFTPTAGGTTDWTYSVAVTGYQSPSAAGAINAATYRYRAESSDLSQWEVGFGSYNSSTGVFSRATVLFNSLGTTAKVSFTVAPQVAIVALAEDLAAIGLGLVPSLSTVTITIASPAVITWTAHGLLPNATVYFYTGGALPTGLTASDTSVSSPTLYYVIGSSITANTFQVATSLANAKAGTAVNTSGTQSGSQGAVANAFAPAGYVGEFIYNVVPASPGVTLTNNVDAVWNSISLSAGIWEVGGNIGVTKSGASTPAFTTIHSSQGIGITTITSSPDQGSTTAFHISSNDPNGYIFPQGNKVLTLTTPGTLNAVVEPGFTGGAAVAYGTISARRIA